MCPRPLRSSRRIGAAATTQVVDQPLNAAAGVDTQTSELAVYRESGSGVSIPWTDKGILKFAPAGPALPPDRLVRPGDRHPARWETAFGDITGLGTEKSALGKLVCPSPERRLSGVIRAVDLEGSFTSLLL